MRTTPFYNQFEKPSLIYPKLELKLRSSSKALVWIGMAISILMIIFESIIDGVMTLDSQMYDRRIGFGVTYMGIGVGILGVITASLGIGAFRSMSGNKYLIVAHFIMSICCIAADFIMLIVALAGLAYFKIFIQDQSGRYSDRMTSELSAMLVGLIALEALILIAASFHFIVSIVSIAFICTRWCHGNEKTYVIVGPAANKPIQNEDNQFDTISQIFSSMTHI